MKKKSTLGNKILAVCLLVLSAIPMITEKGSHRIYTYVHGCNSAVLCKKKLHLCMKGSTRTLSFLREIYICSNGNNNKIKEILL